MSFKAGLLKSGTFFRLRINFFSFYSKKFIERSKIENLKFCPKFAYFENLYSLQKSVENSQIVSVKRAANALLKSREKLPPKRIEELSLRVAEFLKIDLNSNSNEICDEKLREISQIDAKEENPDFEIDHGEKVVKFFQNSPEFQEFSKFGGLHKFEIIWRQNFVENMKPKYLPEDWSIDHNWDRFSEQK